MSYAALVLGTLGAYVHLLTNPYEKVPLISSVLGILWWFLITLHFRSEKKVEKFYYIPAILLLLVVFGQLPSLVIILRAYMEPVQVVNITFLSLSLFILITCVYYRSVRRKKG
jgi:uncharacterized membrane protein